MIAVASPNIPDANIPAAATLLQGALTGLTSAITSSGQSISMALNGASMKEIKAAADIAQAEMKMDSMQDREEKKNWWTRFLNEKGKWVKEWGQRVAQFNKLMMMIAKFKPIILLCVAIILIFSNLLFYIIMVIAFLVAAALEIIYFLLSLPPFIQIMAFIFFMITEFLPMIAIILFMVALLVFAAIFCGLAFILNAITGGKLKGMVLCQNGPASWYKIPNWHLTNKFDRGLFCSRPCAKGYAPDVSGVMCIRKSRFSPAYCPQAQVMRFYSGEGKKDKRYIYKDKRVATDFRFQSKTPARREDVLFSHWMDMRKYLEECNNPINLKGVSQYDTMAISLCANIDALSDGALSKLDKEVILKMQEVCKQGFCNSQTAFPFCNSLAVASDDDTSDFLKKIILFIISMIVFVLTLVFIFAYMNEDV